MAELGCDGASVVSCFGEPTALDTLAPAGAARCRIAPDEAMFVAPPGEAAALLRDAQAVTAGDPHALVFDATDGWAMWTLAGPDARAAFAYLSELKLPDEGFVQGHVANVPARVLAHAERLDLFVPAMWGEHLRSRILSRCPGVVEVTTP